MKRLLFLALWLPVLAFADTYTGDVTWQDTTPQSAQYSPSYNVEWRVNGGNL